MTSKIAEFLVKVTENNWPKPAVGYGALPLLVFLTITTTLAPKTNEVYIPHLLIGACSLAAVSTLVWWLCNRVRCHPKGSIGFDLILAHEDPKQGIRIKADFITSLRSLLLNSTTTGRFSFIEHSKYACRGHIDERSAIELSTKTRSVFILFGHTKLRLIDGKEQHVLELGGGVRHAPVAESISKQIAAEMRDALGKDVIIAQENDLFSFRITAERIDIAARYIVGIAALVSKDLDYSEHLFRDLMVRLSHIKSTDSPEIAKIRNRLPSRLGEVGILKCKAISDQYVFGGQKHETMILLDQELRKFEKFTQGWYSGHLLSSMCSFMLRRDIKMAKLSLGSCRIVPDSTWRYSLAFLAAYEGDLQKAWKNYQIAFNKPPSDPSVPNQCEAFINKILAEEPSKTQLWYCLGLINLKGKNDVAGAKRDFTMFLATTLPNEFLPQRKLAARYINKIHTELNLPINFIEAREIAA